MILLVIYEVVVLCRAVLRRVSARKASALATPPTRATYYRCSEARSSGRRASGASLTHLLLLMVLTSAAASTQTTILPTARTTLSMAVYKAIPRKFARIHPRFLTPTVVDRGDGGRLDSPVRDHELHLGRRRLSPTR